MYRSYIFFWIRLQDRWYFNFRFTELQVEISECLWFGRLIESSYSSHVGHVSLGEKMVLPSANDPSGYRAFHQRFYFFPAVIIKIT